MSREADAVASVERIVDAADEADALLRAAIEELAARYATGVGIRFVEEGTFTDGPWAGPGGTPATEIPILYDGDLVAELVTTAVLDDAARAAWERIAALLSPYCLVGWDIGGEDWEP